MMKLFYAETEKMMAIAEEEEQIQKKLSGVVQKHVESDESESASGSES